MRRALLAFAVAALTMSAAGTARAAPDPGWTLSTTDFSNTFTRLAYVGNGYIGQRIPAAGAGYLGAQGVNGWPTFSERITTAVARGVYAEVPGAETATGGYGTMQVIADLPTWSAMTFSSQSGTYSSQTASADDVADYRQTLDVRDGVVTTSGLWTAPGGEQARFTYRVLADRARRHVALVQLDLTPLWTGVATVSGLLDGTGARRTYPVDVGYDLPTHTAYVASATTGLNIPVAEAQTMSYSGAVHPTATVPVMATPAQTAGEQVAFAVQSGTTYRFTKFVTVVTGRDSDNPEDAARNEVRDAAALGAPAILAENAAAWDHIWQRDILVPGEPRLQQVVHANEYSLYASIGSESPGSIGPTGLSAEGYAGLVFWDADTWMYPGLLALQPELARTMVDYRYQTLAAAHRNAAEYGFKGAYYPWTSAYDGNMDSNCYGVVAAAGTPVADSNRSCTEELHLQGDIALAQWQYYEATGDRDWLAHRGWPVLKGIADFWASRATPDGPGRYSIDNVQPPDENHTGVNNSAYTNAVAALSLELAARAAAIVGQAVPAQWARVADGLKATMPFDKAKNIYLEYDGYNGETIKQADVVMLSYPLEFPMPASVAAADVDYYAPVTSPDGPAMTDAIHSIDVSAVDAPGCAAYSYLLRSYTPYLREPFLQLSETRTDGILGVPVAAFDFLTAVGGFEQEFVYGFTGLRLHPDAVRLDPSLPPQLPEVVLRDVRWQGRTFSVDVRRDRTVVTLVSGAALPVDTPAGPRAVAPGGRLTLPTRRPDEQPTDDLARCRQVSASSQVAGNEPVAANDGSDVTTWVPAAAQATLTVDLGRAKAIHQVVVRKGDTGQYAYAVQGSADGRHWIPLGSTAGSTGQVDRFAVAGRTVRFVRLSFPGGSSAPVPSIAELTVTS